MQVITNEDTGIQHNQHLVTLVRRGLYMSVYYVLGALIELFDYDLSS